MQALRSRENEGTGDSKEHEWCWTKIGPAYEMWDRLMNMDIVKKYFGKYIDAQEQFFNHYSSLVSILILGKMFFMNLVE